LESNLNYIIVLDETFLALTPTESGTIIIQYEIFNKFKKIA